MISAFEKVVLHKLFKKRRIGSYHIRMATVMKSGFKPHEKGLVKKAILSLIKQGYVEWKKKSEEALSIKVDKLKEVKQLIGGQPPPLIFK